MSLENERFVEDMVASGQFVNREALLDRAVGLLREQLQPNTDDMARQLTAHEWCDRFEEWADSHKPQNYEVDDSRESIYAGRGE